MEGWQPLYYLGGVIIGIKSILIEWERSAGSDRFALGIRAYEQSADPVWSAHADAERQEGVASDAGVLAGQPSRWGSDALGLQECPMLGERLQEPDGASYWPAIQAGFRIRRERMGESKAKAVRLPPH